MRFPRTLTLLVIILAALAGTILATAIALLWRDEFATRPGMPTYYLGISALIRHTPVAGAIEPPSYVGSVGSSRQAPRSEVRLAVIPGQADAIWQGWQAYVRQFGFIPMPEPGVESDTSSQRMVFLGPQRRGMAVLVREPADDGAGETWLTLLHVH